VTEGRSKNSRRRTTIRIPGRYIHQVKVVPVIKSSDLTRSISFYTRTLDLELADPSDAGPVVEVFHGVHAG
jgi:hypothetical protein